MEVITFVLGGSRSGKSRAAERYAAEQAQTRGLAVTYLATAVLQRSDAEFLERIDAHRRRRPSSWATAEIDCTEELPAALGSLDALVILDSVGTWVAAAPDFVADGGKLLAALESRRERRLPTVVVSDEVGLGVHPETSLGRSFRDALGTMNQQIAATADKVVLVVAGRELVIGQSDR